MTSVALANILSRHNTLTSLDLGDCKMGPLGALGVVRALQSSTASKQLHKLHFYSNEVSEQKFF